MAFKEEEKYLMFMLDEEFYGIPILKVNEIIGVMEITSIPRSPDFMKGIINLRGKIIPVIDLRLKFKMDERTYDEQTCIIIAEITLHGNKQFVGVVVDKVAEVVNVYGKDIELPPQYGQESEEDFLIGVGKVKEKVLMLLDIEAIVNCQELINIVKKNIDKESDKTSEKEVKEVKKV